MIYNLYFMNVKSQISAEDPVVWGIGNRDLARRTAIEILRKSRRTAIGIYTDVGGNEIYQGYVRYEGDGYFFHSYSGKKWRINADGRIAKLKKRAAPFGL